MKCSVNSVEKGDKTGKERSRAADCAVRLLTLEYLKQLHGVVENSIPYPLEDKKLFMGSAVQQFCFTAPALPLAVATSENETAHLLHIE